MPSTTVTASHVTQGRVEYKSTIPRSTDEGLDLWEDYRDKVGIIFKLSVKFINNKVFMQMINSRNDKETDSTELILLTKRRPLIPQPLQCQNAFIPWSSEVKYLGLILDSKLLFTKHIKSVVHKAMGSFLKIFPLLARNSPLTYSLNSSSTNSFYAPRSHTLPRYGAPRPQPITNTYKSINPNAYAS